VDIVSIKVDKSEGIKLSIVSRVDDILSSVDVIVPEIVEEIVSTVEEILSTTDFIGSIMGFNAFFTSSAMPFIASSICPIGLSKPISHTHLCFP